MKKSCLLFFSLALAGCGAGMTWMPERPARLMPQVRGVAVLPFPGGGEVSDDFYDGVSTELWPGLVAPRARTAEALKAAGLLPPGYAITREQALALAARLGADTVLSAEMDGEGVLRLKVTDSPSGTQWRKTRRVNDERDLRAFVREIRAGFEAKQQAAKSSKKVISGPRKYKRQHPGGAQDGPAPTDASGSTSPAPTGADGAAGAPQPGAVSAPAADGATQPQTETEPLGGSTIKNFDYSDMNGSGGN